MPTMQRMQTPPDSLASPVPSWADPFGGWQAATRWSAIASEFMTRGWQQWLELVTVWPALDAPARALAATQAGTQEARNARAIQEQVREAAPQAKQGRPSEAAPQAKQGTRRAAARKRAERPAAGAATRRTPPRRTARAQAAARTSRTRG